MHDFDIGQALPAHGRLFFFADAAMLASGDYGVAGGEAVLYDAAIQPASSATESSTPPRHTPAFGDVPLTCSPEPTLPPLRSLAVERFRLDSDERMAYLKLLGTLGRLHGGDQRVHRALGYPQQLHWDLQQGDEHWRLLLQVSSETSAHMDWGDLGIVHYTIRATDLQRQRFEDVRLVVQSS